jgi:hypothetical protein
VLKTSAFVICGWVDLYLRNWVKIAQENQVQEAPFADSSAVLTKYSDSEFRLLMTRRFPNRRLCLLTCSLMSGHL